MPRLIDAEELIEVAHRERLDSRERIERMIEAAPTVDAEPVRHGRWVHGKELSRDYIGDACVSIHYDKWWCSECNYPIEEQPLWMHCPNCGAKMDEVEDG